MEKRTASCAIGSPSIADVAALPEAAPGVGVAPQELVVADRLDAVDEVAQSRGGRRPGAGGGDDRQAVDRGRLARLHPAADHVARLQRAAHHRRPGGGHGDGGQAVPAPVPTARHGQEAGRLQRLDGRLASRPAGVRDAETALPDEHAGGLLQRGLGAQRHHGPVVERGEARRTHPHHASGALALAPLAHHEALVHVQRAAMFQDLAVGQREQSAVQAQPHAGPVGRRHGLAYHGVSRAVAEHAGHEGGRRAGRRTFFQGPARAALAVGDREPRLHLALAEGIEPLHPVEPGLVRRQVPGNPPGRPARGTRSARRAAAGR